VTIALTQARCPDKRIAVILRDLGLPKATYHRWTNRACQQQLADHIATPHREGIPPTPAEVQGVHAFADTHFGLGYKRMAYSLMLEKQAFSLALV
jgi:hypothetical protein